LAILVLLYGFGPPVPWPNAGPAGTYQALFQSQCREVPVEQQCSDSGIATITIVVNHKPVAVADAFDKSVNSGDKVTLNGGQSNDEDGDDLTYDWAQSSAPPTVGG
jgi:hypothetical protein